MFLGSGPDLSVSKVIMFHLMFWLCSWRLLFSEQTRVMLGWHGLGPVGEAQFVEVETLVSFQFVDVFEIVRSGS